MTIKTQKTLEYERLILMDVRVANAYEAFSVYNVKTSQNAKKVSAQEKVEAKKDTFVLSDKIADYQFAKKAVAASPDIREDRVASIKSQISSGRYFVNGNAVAAKLFQGWNE